MQTKILVFNALCKWEEVYDWYLLSKGLVKTSFFVNLSKFGFQFSRAQKRLPISKTSVLPSDAWYLICGNVDDEVIDLDVWGHSKSMLDAT